MEVRKGQRGRGSERKKEEDEGWKVKKEEMEGKIYEKQVEEKWKKGENGGKKKVNMRECGRGEKGSRKCSNEERSKMGK